MVDQNPPTPPLPPKKAKIPKKKGPIRTEVVVPLLVVFVLVILYFYLFFDLHLKKALEWAGYQVVGAEVDIELIETKFSAASIRIKNIEITNPSKPTHDMLVLGEIRFALSWDGLLRAKAIVDEIAVEQVGIDVARKTVGKVKPPEPPKPSVVGKELNQFKRDSLLQIQKDYHGNALSDIAALLGGGSVQDQLKNIQSQLTSETKIKEAQAMFDQKSKEWQEKIKTLPKPQEIDQLGKDISQIKTGGFSNPAEIIENVQKLQKVIQSADAYIKTTQNVSGSVGSDYQKFQDSLKDLEKSVRADVESIEQKLKIPKIDPKSLTQALVMGYLQKHLEKLSYYKELAQKYLPPKFTKKKDPNATAAADVENNIQPHPRARGVTYEFGKQFSYPLFWIKKVSLSSKPMPAMGIGAFSGLIENITSNQFFIQKPTTAHFAGDFPAQQVQGFVLNSTLDNLKGSPLIKFDSSIASYPISQAVLVESPDVGVSLASAQGKLQIQGQFNDFETAEINVDNQFGSSVFDIKANNDIIKNILSGTFDKLKQSYIRARLWGDLPILSSAIESNIGSTLSAAFSAQIQKQIADLRKQIEDRVQGAIKGQKENLEKSVAQTKAQLDGEVKKVTNQIDVQKKQAESQMKNSQKSGQKQGEDMLNNLKKGLGF